MYYQNFNQGYNQSGQYIPPSGYNINTNYQAYGPNITPFQNQNFNQGYNQNANNSYQSYEQYIDDKFSTIERQIKNIDTRLQKLETLSNDNINENIYMI